MENLLHDLVKYLSFLRNHFCFQGLNFSGLYEMYCLVLLYTFTDLLILKLFVVTDSSEFQCCYFDLFSRYCGLHFFTGFGNSFSLFSSDYVWRRSKMLVSCLSLVTWFLFLRILSHVFLSVTVFGVWCRPGRVNSWKVLKTEGNLRMVDLIIILLFSRKRFQMMVKITWPIVTLAAST